MALRADPSVRAVVPDVPIQADRLGGEAGGLRTANLPNQVVPAGIRRVRADDSPVAKIDGRDERVDVDIAILDSGIADHSDLVIAGGYDCTSAFPDAFRDRNSHGTHVAGIAAARDDARGVVGVAPGARLWAVKILNDNDQGSLSSFACGVDWVMSQRDPHDPSRPLIEVVNMSVSALLSDRIDTACGTVVPDPLHQAICASVADGTTYVAAAGNQGYDAAFRRPAAYDEVITVSAMVDYDGRPGGLASQSDYCPWYGADADDTYADFSNYGPDVDIIAPGKCVLSTYRDNIWAYMSGTSMATPTVAGAAALYMSQYHGAKPGQVRQALRASSVRDWLTHTDPDGQIDGLLDIHAPGPPPDFRVSVGTFNGRLVPGSFAEIPITVTHTNGHDTPVTLDVLGVPADVRATVRQDSPDAAVLVLEADTALTAGTMTLRVRGSDGELKRKKSLTISRSGSTRASFSAPDEGTTTVTGSESTVTVAWGETSSAGDTPLRRTIRRQHALPVEAGSCAGVAWSSDGPAIQSSEADPDGSPSTGWRMTADDLDTDGCYRWIVALKDGSKSPARWASGSVIVDSTPPLAPDVEATGQGVWQNTANATVWVREGTGSLTLTATSRDKASGGASNRFGPLSAPAGWAHASSNVPTDPARIEIGWDSSAQDTSLAVSSTDDVGLTSVGRSVSLRVDATAPSTPTWIEPKREDDGGMPMVTRSQELMWGNTLDTGSGLAGLQLVHRQRGDIANIGSCSGVTYANDGAARLLRRHHSESELRTASCYRWILTARDQVGNLGGSTVSLPVLVDAVAPSGDFTSPDEGTSQTLSDTGLWVRWTESESGGSGGLRRRVELEQARANDDTCDGLFWRYKGVGSSAASPVFFSDLREGFCYRWRLIVSDEADNAITRISGIVYRPSSEPDV